MIAEKLFELKNSNPELFSQAWEKLPQSTQDNILSYLKKHKPETVHTAAPAAVDPGKPERKKGLFQRLLRETGETLQPSERPLYEWADGELLAHTVLEPDTIETSHHVKGKANLNVATELRRISKQNRVQIVQNELIRRLLLTIAGKN